MPCNFRAELISAVNSNPTLKSVHQRYETITNQIILKMAGSKYKYNSDEYLDEYLVVSKPLISDFTISEKLLLAAMKFNNAQLEKMLVDYGEVNSILTICMDEKHLYKY